MHESLVPDVIGMRSLYNFGDFRPWFIMTMEYDARLGGRRAEVIAMDSPGAH
jgi:hypothetical protein